jgi:hypothetical protein
LKHFREVIAASTPQEAARLRKEAGAKALYIAGGTMVVPLAVKGIEVLVDIGRLDLAGTATKDGKVTIGALTRLADLRRPPQVRHPDYPERRHRGGLPRGRSSAFGSRRRPACDGRQARDREGRLLHRKR